MNNWKNIVNRIFNPHLLIILLLIPIAVMLLVFGLSDRFHGTPLAYISYLVSAYTLIVSVWGFSKWIRSFINGFWDMPLIQKINAHPAGYLLLNDIAFRGTASIYQGFAINTVYTIFRGITAYLYHSVWFAAIAVYYLFLGIIRLTLVLHVFRIKRYQNSDDRIIFEFRGYRLCGLLMLLLNAGMSGMTVLMVRDNFHYEYPGYVIYLSALYTFYTAITATINIFKFRKLKSPILSASKAITFTGAMLSVMALQTAMIAQFGGEDPVFRQTANTITGASVCIGSVVIAFFMIYRGTYHIKELKGRKGEESFIMNEREEVFTYEYTARQQKEIREIREKYRQKSNEDSKMDKLRKLDASVTKKGTCVSLVVGVLGCMVLGTGMSCVMVWGEHLFLIGVLVGFVGLIGVICAYPLYTHITRKERQRLAPEILKLTDELLK